MLFRSDKKNVLFIDNSSGNKNEVHPNGGVAIHRYDSVLDFQLDYGGTYSSFYYLKINGQ